MHAFYNYSVLFLLVQEQNKTFDGKYIFVLFSKLFSLLLFYIPVDPKQNRTIKLNRENFWCFPTTEGAVAVRQLWKLRQDF